MQVNDLRADIQDFQQRIFSGDPVEYNSAINQYVEPQAAYTSALVNTHGASRIKNVQALEKLFVRERVVDVKGSGREGFKDWDEDSQTFTALTTTTYSLPITLPLIDISFTFPTSLILHLNINEDNDLDAEGNDSMVEDAGIYSDDDDDGGSAKGRRGQKEREDGELSVYGERSRKYVVTKWEEKGPLDVVLAHSGNLAKKLHLHLLRPLTTILLRPLTTILLLLLAGTQHFIHAHPLKNGYIAFMTAAFWTLLRETNEFVIRDVLGGLGGGRGYGGSAYRPVNRLTEQLPTSVLLSLGSSRSSSPIPTPTKSTSKGFQPRSGLGSTTSASNVNVSGTHTGNQDLGDGTTSYAGAVADGMEHTHQHPVEGEGHSVGNQGEDHEGGGEATSCAEALKEGVQEGHVHPSNVEGEGQGDRGTESGSQQHHASYAEVAAPE